MNLPAAYAVFTIDRRAKSEDSCTVQLHEFTSTAQLAVKDLIAARARREGFTGTADEYMLKQGWWIMPLYPASNLINAASQVEQWWLKHGQQKFDGAPAAIFLLRHALERLK